MRRQLVVVIVGVVAGALLLAGLGTYLLAGRRVRHDSAAAVLRQAREVAAEIPLVIDIKARAVRRGVLGVLEQTDGMRFAILRPDGALEGTFPLGFTSKDLPRRRLAGGAAASGTVGSTAFAAVPVPSVSSARLPALGNGGLLEVVLVQRLPAAGLGLEYLLLVSGASLAVAVAAAAVLSRRITRPVVDAVTTTRRIAGGDLEARVPEEVGAYPELSSLTASINSMAASLARSRTLQRQFLLSVSHDLRTPLTSILGYAEAIGDGTVHDAGRAARIIAAESRRLERLVGDLLELARLDSEQFSLAIEETDVAKVVRDAAEGFRPAVEEAGLELVVHAAEPGSSRAAVDRDRLSQVVANLVENAYKFARRRVLVEVGRTGTAVTISVDDDGPGIAAAEQSRVFERLYQATSRTASRQAGSGLGLAIVAELVTAMGGSIGVRSPATGDGGTRMEVRFPAGPPLPPHDGAMPPEGMGRSPCGRTPGYHRSPGPPS